MIIDRSKYRKNEGRSLTIDKETLGNQQTLEVSTIVPKNAKIDKEDKTSFEEFKVVYKGAIDNKCLETYGVCDDDLWNDTAKEMYLASKTYIPDETKNSGDLGVKEESRRIIKHDKVVESNNKTEPLNETINNFNDPDEVAEALVNISKLANEIEDYWNNINDEDKRQIDDEFDEPVSNHIRWLISDISDILDNELKDYKELFENKEYSKQD